MHDWFCSNGPVSHYLPWELRALTFGLCVCYCIYACLKSEYAITFFYFQCAIASIRACDLKNWARLIKMWINEGILFVYPHCLSVFALRSRFCCSSLFLSSLLLHFLLSVFSSAFSLSADKTSPHCATALMGNMCRLEVTLSRPTCLTVL